MVIVAATPDGKPKDSGYQARVISRLWVARWRLATIFEGSVKGDVRSAIEDLLHVTAKEMAKELYESGWAIAHPGAARRQEDMPVQEQERRFSRGTE